MDYRVPVKVGSVIGDMHCTTLTRIQANGGKGFFGPDLRMYRISDVHEFPNKEGRETWATVIARNTGISMPFNKLLYVCNIEADGTLLVMYSYDGRSGGQARLTLIATELHRDNDEDPFADTPLS